MRAGATAVRGRMVRARDGKSGSQIHDEMGKSGKGNFIESAEVQMREKGRTEAITNPSRCPSLAVIGWKRHREAATTYNFDVVLYNGGYHGRVVDRS